MIIRYQYTGPSGYVPDLGLLETGQTVTPRIITARIYRMIEDKILTVIENKEIKPTKTKG